MFKAISIAMLVLFFTTASPAAADDFGFLSTIEKQAREDIQFFHEHLSTLFKLPIEQIEDLAGIVPKPSDIFMILKIGELSGQPVENVLETYKKNREKGWGAIAREMGIKPGSQAFHDLKRSGELFSREQSAQSGQHQGKDKSKGKGKKKGKK